MQVGTRLTCCSEGQSNRVQQGQAKHVMLGNNKKYHHSYRQDLSHDNHDIP